jgi:hypothetical protein
MSSRREDFKEEIKKRSRAESRKLPTKVLNFVKEIMVLKHR